MDDIEVEIEKFLLGVCFFMPGNLSLDQSCTRMNDHLPSVLKSMQCGKVLEFSHDCRVLSLLTMKVLLLLLQVSLELNMIHV